MVDPKKDSLLGMAALRLPEAEEYLETRRRLANPPTEVPHTEPSLLGVGKPSNTTRKILIDMLGNSLIDLVPQHNETEGYPPLEPAPGNLSHNVTVLPDLMYRHSTPIILIYCIAYLVVFVVGLVGNCFVIAVVYRSPRMRTVTNFFIVNLAVADILVIVFCLPATLMSNIFVPWVLGWWMCKTVPYVQGVSVAASVYSLIAVSVDRFLAIWWPMKCQITTRRARIMILFIWLIAVTTTIPWALFFDLVVIFGERPDIQLCIEVWPDYLDGSLYFLIANLLFCYILPLILISMCYILIWIKVCKRHIPSDTKDAQMERMQQKSKVKVVKMLVAVVILFVLSWLPLYVIFARIKLGGEITAWEEETLIFFTPIAQWLGASNSCINPILYAFFNNKYRRGFTAILKSRRCCSTLRYYDAVAMANSSSASMRKSSYYVTNNSTRRPPLVHQDSTASYRGPPIHQDSSASFVSNTSSVRRAPPVHQDSNVSYISNNTGV